MSWTTERVEDVMVLGFGQIFKIDFESSLAFAQTIEELVEGERKLLIDLTGVEYIDSRDLGILVYGMNRALELGIDARMTVGSEAVSEVFRVTHLDRVYDIFPDRAGGLVSFEADVL